MQKEKKGENAHLSAVFQGMKCEVIVSAMQEVFSNHSYLKERCHFLQDMFVQLLCGIARYLVS